GGRAAAARYCAADTFRRSPRCLPPAQPRCGAGDQLAARLVAGNRAGSLPVPPFRPLPPVGSGLLPSPWVRPAGDAELRRLSQLGGTGPGLADRRGDSGARRQGIRRGTPHPRRKVEADRAGVTVLRSTLLLTLTGNLFFDLFCLSPRMDVLLFGKPTTGT